MISKLKLLLILVLILLMFFLWNPVRLNAQESDTVSLKGSMENEYGSKIGYARVTIAVLEAGKGRVGTNVGTGKAFPGKEFVTYAGASGKWQAKIPAGEVLMIQVSANGYEPARKIIPALKWPGSTPSENKKPGEVVFVLKEGINGILFGSIEYLQLYVNPAMQKKLFELIHGGKSGAVGKHIESRLKPGQKKYAYAFAGYVVFYNTEIQFEDRQREAKVFFDKAGSKLWFNLMGHFYLKKNRYKKSLSYYALGQTTKQKADDLFFLAKTFEKQEEKENAAKCYRMALDDYNVMIKSIKYKWDSEYVNNSIFCRSKLEKTFLAEGNEETKKKELKSILKKAGNYCEKLNEIAIYYFCFEEKRDHVFLVTELGKALDGPASFFMEFYPIKLRGKRIIDYYKYDLQFIKKEKGSMYENRKLILEHLDSGNPGIPVRSYTIRKPLYGPHTLIGFGWQEHFIYRITGTERIFEREALVLEATPKWSGDMNKMFGEIWVDKKKGAVLKIEWNHRRVQNKEQIRARGFILNREPEFKFISEFGLQRGNLWFPSRSSMVESYLKEGKKPFERLRITVDYNKYTFFVVDETVEVEDNL